MKEEFLHQPLDSPFLCLTHLRTLEQVICHFQSGPTIEILRGAIGARSLAAPRANQLKCRNSCLIIKWLASLPAVNSTFNKQVLTFGPVITGY
ncbi:hypothetical protein J6590_023970 [Homalodisca vitripennis]|nr:hypothetical protein J6590_023970 [Homalodisca vitripennis]